MVERVVSPAFLNRGVVTQYCGQDTVRTKGSFIWNIDDTGHRRSSEAIDIMARYSCYYRSSLLRFPYIVSRYAINRIGIPQTFTHAETLIRSGSARTNARARDRAETCRKRTEFTQPPRRTWFGVEESWDILSYRGGNLKRMSEFTFTRYAPAFTSGSFDSLRSWAHSLCLPDLLSVIEIGTPDAVHRRWQNSGHTGGTLYTRERNRAVVARTSHSRSDRRLTRSQMAIAPWPRRQKDARMSFKGCSIFFCWVNEL